MSTELLCTLSLLFQPPFPIPVLVFPGFQLSFWGVEALL